MIEKKSVHPFVLFQMREQERHPDLQVGEEDEGAEERLVAAHAQGRPRRPPRYHM